jgi:CRP-like cAMP-binding protein
MSPRQPSLQLFLDRLTSRSALSEREREAILGLPAQAMQVAANYDFVRLGEIVDHTCLIAEGLVARFDQNADGGRQITALHIVGDMPDLQTVTQPSATCALQALSPVTLARVPHSALRAAAAAHPGLAQALWRDSIVDSMILAQWVLNLGRRDSKTRIAHLLCEMACRSRARPERGEVVFRLPITQLQLADATGLSPVHVNRTLKALATAGVSFRHQIVRIADWQRLTGIGDFDSAYLQPPEAATAS